MSNRGVFVVLVFTFHFLLFTSHAQQFGGNPPSVKWKQINTDTARIIFPEGMDSTAQRVAAVVHYLAKNKPLKLGDKLYKVNIVLQTQTTIANGYVGLAPFRSEYFLTPLVNNFKLGSINWAEGLAIHEYRHVEQYNNFRHGITNALYFLFGEEGWLVGINASVPDWFFEGDAVYHETIFSNQGRGRLPFFLNQYKSLWQYNKNYSWMKLRNGSYKDYVPNHYALGYLLVNYGYRKYGDEFWEKVTHDASGFKGLFYPFQKAVKKYSGVDYKKFRNDAFEFSKKMVGVTGDERIATQPKINRSDTAGIKNLTALNEKYVTNYMFPYQAGEDSLIYLKNSYRHIYSFYLKDKNGEQRLRVKDISDDQQFSYRNGKIVYAAYETNPRWGWKDYSVLRIYDIRSKEQHTVGHNTKYFTPDLSPDEKKLTAVYIAPGGKSELHVLDLNGNILQRFHSAEIGLFTDPKFIDDDHIVTAVRLVNGRMALAIADVVVGSVERLTVPSYAVIGYPSVSNGTVYFTGSFSGNDEIYAVRLKDKKVFQLTQTALGNYNVNANSSKLVWSGFTPEGYQLKEMEINEGMWNEVGELALTEPVQFLEPEKAGNDILLNKVEGRKFDVKKYRQAGHLFYVYGWRPYLVDPDYYYTLYSENILNTVSAEAFYHYNRTDLSHGFGSYFLYGGWFPFINAGFEYTSGKPITINNKFTRIHQTEISAGLSIPLDLTRGRTFKTLSIGSNYVLNRQSFSGALKDSLGSVDFGYLSHNFSFILSQQKAVQHIYPHLGFNLFLTHRHALSVYDGYQFNASGAVFFPGFHPAHSIVATAAFHQRDTSNILFSNLFSVSRGYDSYNLSRMWRVSGDYHFSIAYPDWGFANIFYLSRVRANGFFDLTKAYSKNKQSTRKLRSVGGEMYFDTKWWNEYALSFGVRISHLLDNGLSPGEKAGSNFFEILVPIVIPK